MKIDGTTALISGGASGLGLATAKRLVQAGAHVVVLDRRETAGPELEALGPAITYAQADVTRPEQLADAIDSAVAGSELRAVVHTAGIGEIIRVVERDGSPGSLEKFQRVIDINLVGSFNVLSLAAARMAANEPLDGDRGVVIMTASVAAYEGQIGQIAYSASKAAIVGMTIVAARDLASKGIRVNTIAPGTFDTPLLAQLSEEVRASLGKAVPHPSRLGDPDEYGFLAQHIIENPVLNGETIRLDGAIRMPPR